MDVLIRFERKRERKGKIGNYWHSSWQLRNCKLDKRTERNSYKRNGNESTKKDLLYLCACVRVCIWSLCRRAREKGSKTLCIFAHCHCADCIHICYKPFVSHQSIIYSNEIEWSAVKRRCCRHTVRHNIKGIWPCSSAMLLSLLLLQWLLLLLLWLQKS